MTGVNPYDGLESIHSMTRVIPFGDWVRGSSNPMIEGRVTVHSASRKVFDLSLGPRKRGNRELK